MRDIKLITKDTDLSNIYMLDWDTYCNGIYYDVYNVDGYIHTIGGKWGENSFWACEKGEKPTFENLIEFGGEICSWGIKIEANNWIKTKYDETEMRSNYKVKILRNDKVFYSFGVNDMDYGLCKARKLLFEIEEHGLSFGSRNYVKNIVGRKILWRYEPAIIESYSLDGNLIIIPDGKDRFENVSDTYYDNENYVAEDLFASSIDWFR
jgi:hypothetical protein